MDLIGVLARKNSKITYVFRQLEMILQGEIKSSRSKTVILFDFVNSCFRLGMFSRLTATSILALNVYLVSFVLLFQFSSSNSNAANYCPNKTHNPY